MNLSIVESFPAILRKNSIRLDIEKGQRVFRKGDRTEYLYLIVRGRFQEVSYLCAGNVATLQVLNREEFLGETGLYFDFYHSTAIAQTKAQVIAFPKAIVLQTLQQSPVSTELIIKILAQKISELQTRLEWRNISSADFRVLNYLQHKLDKSVSNDNSQSLTLDAPLQEIAAELGFVPSTLSRALAKLEAEQQIIRDRNYITLIDTDVA